MSDDRPPVYVEESGLVVYRASALDLCPADLLAYRTGQEPAPFTAEQLERMSEGVLHEPEIVAWVGTKGYATSHTGDHQLEVDWQVVPGVVVRGHPDGLAHRRVDDELFTLECKALGKALFSKGLPYLLETYRAQLSWEYHATLHQVLLVVKNRDSGRKKSYDFDEFAGRLMSASELRSHVLNVEMAARLGRELECNRASRWFCRFPWRQLDGGSGGGSGAGGHDQGEEVTAQSGELPASSPLASLASSLHRLREQQRGLHEEEQSVRDAVIQAMGTRKRTKAGEWKVRLSWQTRKGFNEKKLVEKFGEEALSECRTESASFPVVVVEAAPTPLTPAPILPSTMTSVDGASEPATSS